MHCAIVCHAGAVLFMSFFFVSVVNVPMYKPLTASIRLIHILLEVMWFLFIILTKQISSNHTFFF